MKKNELTPERFEIRDFTKTNTIFLVLYGIYKDTIEPDITYRMFESMYCSEELMYIDFTLFTSGEKRAGFSAAFFYRTRLNRKTIFIARSATGLAKKYHGKGKHDVQDLYTKFMRFALRHPFAPKYVAAFVISPIVYSELCRFIPQFFPKPGIVVPQKIETLMDEIVVRNGHVREASHPYSVKVPIQVTFTDALLKRIRKSKDENIIYFTRNVVDILDKFGLVVIIHISWRNILGTVLNLSRYNAPKKMRTLKDEFMNHCKAGKQKIASALRKILKNTDDNNAQA